MRRHGGGGGDDTVKGDEKSGKDEKKRAMTPIWSSYKAPGSAASADPIALQSQNEV